MSAFANTLSSYLFHHYALEKSDSMLMIEEEWDYIEERLRHGHSIKRVSQELFEIFNDCFR